MLVRIEREEKRLKGAGYHRNNAQREAVEIRRVRICLQLKELDGWRENGREELRFWSPWRREKLFWVSEGENLGKGGEKKKTEGAAGLGLAENGREGLIREGTLGGAGTGTGGRREQARQTCLVFLSFTVKGDFHTVRLDCFLSLVLWRSHYRGDGEVGFHYCTDYLSLFSTSQSWLLYSMRSNFSTSARRRNWCSSTVAGHAQNLLIMTASCSCVMQSSNKRESC